MKIIVVGGGLIGSSIAFELGCAGHQVTVVDRAVAGQGASIAAGGMIAPQLEAHERDDFLDLGLKSRSLYREWLARIEAVSGVPVGWRESGILRVAFTDGERASLEKVAAWQLGKGLRVEQVDGPAARSLEPSLNERALGALYFPDDHQVDPRRLMASVLTAAVLKKVRFVTAHVRGVAELGGQCVGVDVIGDRLRADLTVIASGAWSGLIAGCAVSPALLKPIRGQAVELRLETGGPSKILASEAGYLIPRGDGRVICGSTREDVGFADSITPAGLQKILAQTVILSPAMARAQVVSHWAGLRPCSADELPILGAGPLPGLLLATGHHRNGILLAPVTARVIAELAGGMNASVSLQPFRYDRFPS